MRAFTIWTWGVRHALAQPVAWALGVGLIALCPLATWLGPFRTAGVDPSWSVATGAALPVALIGASAALVFLGRYAELLAQLAPRARWQAELGTLLLAALLLEACLGLGAWFVSSPGGGAAEAWIAGTAAACVHVAAVGLVALRLRTRLALRVAALWALLWVFPIWVEPSLASGRWRILVDPSWHAGVFSDLGVSPIASVASALALAGWLVAGAAVPLSRSA